MDTSDGSETVITNSTGHHHVIAGAGGGMYGGGVGFNKGWGGHSFLEGGTGGEAEPPAVAIFPHGSLGTGGFGGGGAAGLLPGAGGGYSGGGVQGCFLECNGKDGGMAEGGSSYVDSQGISPSYQADKNKGPGRVYLRLMAEDIAEI